MKHLQSACIYFSFTKNSFAFVSACSDKRCASCNSSLAECDKCFPGYSMLLDSFNITTKCVRDCPKKHEKKVIDGTSICIIQKQQGN